MVKHLAIILLAVLFLYSAAVAQPTTPASAGPSSVEPSSAATSAAQTQPAPSAQAPSASPVMGNQPPSGPRIAPGSVVPVRLTKSIDAKKAKPGDEVLATVTQDLKTNSGEVLVPKDTKVVGHVTETQARSKDQKESEVGIAFDRAVTKDGDLQLPMSIQAIIAPPSNPSDNGGGAYGQSGPASGGGAAPSPMGNHNTPMEGLPRPPSPDAVPTGGTDAQRPPITGNTQGVIGIPDVKLEATTQNATQGSVVTSEKSNVKLESGTLLLLRVN